jgi:hypothetical protein
MQATAVQEFTTGIGKKYFVVLLPAEDPRSPTTCDALTEELEVLDAVLDGPLEARLLGIHDEDRERLTPWLQRTGWITHLGNFPLLPLALSVTLPNLTVVDTPPWITTILDKVAEAFTSLWATAEQAISTECMNCTLVLLRTLKRHSYSGEDNAPFRIPAKQGTRDRYRNQWLTYIIFCCRWYLEHITPNTLSDKYRVIVAPHLFPCVYIPMADGDSHVDVTNLNATNAYVAQFTPSSYPRL